MHAIGVAEDTVINAIKFEKAVRMNLSETIKTNNDLTFLQGQVMMILEQEFFLQRKK